MKLNKHKDVALVINFSGGKDSTAMLDYLCTVYPNVKKYVVFADTGFEHTDAKEWAEMLVARYGLTLNIVRNPNKTFLEMVEKRGQFPAPGLRQCTSDLKRDPINAWIRRNVTEKVIISCIGIRAAESTSRAKKHPLTRDKRMSRAGRKVWTWFPIFQWSTPAVLAYLRMRELPLHRAYDYLPRYSCRVCIFFSPAELLAVKKHDPQAFEAVARLEEKIGRTMRMDRVSLRQIAAEAEPLKTEKRAPAQQLSFAMCAAF